MHGGEHYLIVEETTTHAVAQAAGLVENLLEHEVRESATVQHVKVHVYLLDVDADALVAQVDDLQGLTPVADGNLLVVHIDHLLRVFRDRRGVGGNEELGVVFRHTDDEG